MSKVYMQIKDLNLSGNIIDNGWIENIKYDSGKSNMNAIVILSEIIYWYRPTEIRNEYTGEVEGYKKKFKADKLQKSYEQLGRRFNISKRQAKDACDFLKNLGIISVEFRIVKTKQGMSLSNVMFIEPIFEKLKSITGINREVEEVEDEELDNYELDIEIEEVKKMAENKANVPPVTFKRNTLLQTNVTPITNKRNTYTKNTTENTTENTTTTTDDLKSKIENTINAKITKKEVEKLINNSGEDKIITYLDNWDKFKNVNKNNIVGFFIKAVKEGYIFPKAEKIENNQSNYLNFDQRTYSKEDFEKYYYKVEEKQ